MPHSFSISISLCRYPSARHWVPPAWKIKWVMLLCWEEKLICGCHRQLGAYLVCSNGRGCWALGRLRSHGLQRELWPKRPGNPCSRGQARPARHSPPGGGWHDKESAKEKEGGSKSEHQYEHISRKEITALSHSAPGNPLAPSCSCP